MAAAAGARRVPDFPHSNKNTEQDCMRAGPAGILFTLVSFLAAGCAAPLGDFNQPRPSVINDKILPSVGSFAAASRGEPVSRYPLTDDERELRNLAYAILMPPLERREWERSFAEMRRTRIFANNVPHFDSLAYADNLIESPHRSSTARYARVIEDIRADASRAGPFFDAARRVVAMDEIREKSLPRAASLTPGEFEDAMARIAENRMLIGWVYRRFGERMAGYRLALERLVVATPAPAAVGAERALRALEDRLARIPVVTRTAEAAVPPPRAGAVNK